MMNLIDKIKQAGVVGCGGAGFPTHVKLSGNMEHIIINGMECEPLLRTDRYVMLTYADKLMEAADMLLKETGAVQLTFALKKTYLEEISAITKAIHKKNIHINIYTTTSFYPAGDEHIVVYEVTGKTVPPLNIPIAVGSVVINIGTLLGIYDAMNDKPFTHRFITVTGEVPNPCVLYVPLGTSFLKCIEMAGGMSEECCIVSGGPMMGTRYDMPEAAKLFVGKTTSGILILPIDKYVSNKRLDMDAIKRQAKAACIQCSYCTEFCPRYLLGHPLEPHKIMRKLAYEKLESSLDNADVQAAALCCECGICETYACPMQLKPRQVNVAIKRVLAENGIQYPRSEISTEVNAMREMRKTPSNRVAARSGVLDYYNSNIKDAYSLTPDKVNISLSQGIGASAEPIVHVGDRVACGDMIALCPEGKLGANIHASISGKVTRIDGGITIAGEGSEC